MKKQRIKNLHLNKKSISALHIYGGAADAGNQNPVQAKRSIDLSCYQSCVNYSKYRTCTSCTTVA